MPVTTKEHIVKRFDQELGKLRSQVLEMGGLVEDQISRALSALDDEDLDLAREVIDRERAVNDMDVNADEVSVNLIALRQPVGTDLRMIMSLAKSVTDLERIGDEAEKIARMALRLYGGENSVPNSNLLRDVGSMAKIAKAMLHECLDALARLDVEKAVDIAHGDAELDYEFQSALRRLVTYMMEDPRNIGHAIDIVFIIKALERVGDHAKNIAEYVIYLVKGQDVRHVSMEALAHRALAED
jgi:phosphate transport system protein